MEHSMEITLTGTAAVAPTIDTVAPKSTSVELGGTLEVDVTLSNITTNVVLSIDLNKYDDNDANVADWVASGELTITNSDDVTVNIDIGSTIASSISLDEGENYKIVAYIYELNNGGNWITPALVKMEHSMEITLTGTAAIAPTISSTVPASVDVGDVLSVELTYTSTVDAIVSIELAKYNNSSGDYVDNSQVAYIEKEVVAGTRTMTNLSIDIPASTNPTSILTGESYKVKVSLINRSRNSLATHLKDIELRILPAPVISIRTSTLIAKAGSVISDIFVDSSAGGSITGYSIAPPIGNGLSFDTTTGIIYGTPTAVAQEIIDTITATNAAGQTATATVSITVVSSLGNEDFEKIGFSVSPNPTRAILNITVDEKADYRLLNIRGQVLKKGVSTKGESKINIYSLARGVYFLNIKTGKGSFTEKIVKN